VGTKLSEWDDVACSGSTQSPEHAESLNQVGLYWIPGSHPHVLTAVVHCNIRVGLKVGARCFCMYMQQDEDQSKTWTNLKAAGPRAAAGRGELAPQVHDICLTRDLIILVRSSSSNT
jgi:hypothetical protein